MHRLIVVGAAAVAVLAVGCSSGSEKRTSPTTRAARSASTTTNPTLPTIDPAAPGVVLVDFSDIAAQGDLEPDAVVATFEWGSGPGQLGFRPGQQAESEPPAGFVLTNDETAAIVDQVNHRLVRVKVPGGSRRPSVAAPDLCAGEMRLGPQEVLYIGCGAFVADGINAFATTGSRAGQRVGGPSGRADPQAVFGAPLSLGPTGVVDTAGSAKPLAYVTATGAPLTDPVLLPSPAATRNGANLRITYRTGPGAPLRTWDVVMPRGSSATENDSTLPVPEYLVALPDATVVLADSIPNTGRIYVARLTSHGVARAVTFPRRFINGAAAYSTLRADETGAYILEARDPSGAQLVRYRLDG